MCWHADQEYDQYRECRSDRHECHQVPVRPGGFGTVQLWRRIRHGHDADEALTPGEQGRREACRNSCGQWEEPTNDPHTSIDGRGSRNVDTACIGTYGSLVADELRVPADYGCRVFRKRKRPDDSQSPESQGPRLRAMALAVSPAELGLEPSSESAVWGFVMDTAMSSEQWHCLAVFAEGTTSLYTSAAFGVIGAGTRPGVRAASDALLAEVGRHLGDFAPSNDTAVPPPGQVTLRTLTFAGPRAVTADERDLGHGRHPASPVFHAAHAVIAEIRQVTPS